MKPPLSPEEKLLKLGANIKAISMTSGYSSYSRSPIVWQWLGVVDCPFGDPQHYAGTGMLAEHCPSCSTHDDSECVDELLRLWVHRHDIENTILGYEWGKDMERAFSRVQAWRTKQKDLGK